MNRAAVLFGTALLAVGTAGPAGSAEYDVPWFEARERERLAALRACRDDERLARSAVCDNAERAQDRVEARERAARSGLGRRAGPRRIEDFLTDPAYWADNRVARAGALADCAAGRVFVPGQCAAVRAGEAMDRDPAPRRRGT